MFRLGSGPAVIVIAEMPGITPGVAGFARRVAAIGCTAVMPHLFGVPGRDPVGQRAGARRLRVRLGVRPGLRQPRVHGVGDGAHVTGDRLAACPGGPRARALRRPGGRRHRHVLHRRLRPGDGHPPEPAGAGAVATVAAAGRHPQAAPVDRLLAGGPGDGQGTLRAPKACRCSACASPATASCRRSASSTCASSSATPSSPSSCLTTRRTRTPSATPHSVVTEHLIDEPGEPTRQALDQVLDLFRTRLLAG